MDLFFFENTVDPDQLASEEAIWSGSTLFSTLIENTCLFNWNAAGLHDKNWEGVTH